MSDVQHLAKLAKLTLTGEQVTRFSGQLDAIVDYIAQLNEVDTSSVTFSAPKYGEVMEPRDDVLKESFTQEEALKNAKNTNKGRFMVPNVFEK